MYIFHEIKKMNQILASIGHYTRKLWTMFVVLKKTTPYIAVVIKFVEILWISLVLVGRERNYI